VSTAAALPGWSPDGNWFWDGERWNDAISEDGKWRFDGSAWVAFTGARTPMPSPIPAPPSSPSSSPAAAPAAPVPPSAQAVLPSWVDPSEVERIEREKQERAAIAAQPVEPLPPELDWRRAGEFIQYSHTSTLASWRHGYTSLFIYIGLLWFCSPLALVFVWLTGWRLYTKIYRTVICCVLISALASYARSRYGL
jgi:hypothetical protein